MRIVAISGKRRSGKSTLGDILRDEYGYTPVSLAEPLKQMCRDHFGLTKDQTDGATKETATTYFDYSLPGRHRWLTAREIMISMGQYYRSVDPDFWVKKLFKQMEQDNSKTYVVTDVRFKNELDWMTKHNAIKVRLERDEQYTGTNLLDRSETELDGYTDWDILIPADQNVDMSDLVRTADIINAHVTANR